VRAVDIPVYHGHPAGIVDILVYVYVDPLRRCRHKRLREILTT